jgi:hypothetical protein
MDREQRDDIVAAWLDGNVVSVLTSMRKPMGGWDCEGTPKRISGVALRFVTILYEDRTVFRDCSVA